MVLFNRLLGFVPAGGPRRDSLRSAKSYWLCTRLHWTQLKIVQETITLGVFAVFATVVLMEPLSWRYLGAFARLAGAAAFMFVGRL